MAKVLALDKWARLLKIIKNSGGPFKALYKFWRFDTLKDGKLVGKDCLGNLYYENDEYFIPRNRWVEYHPRYAWDYDASQISSEWYGWIHHKTDKYPNYDCAKCCLFCCTWAHAWLQGHQENKTQTVQAYYPYRTTKPYLQVWDGCSKSSRC